MRLLVEVILTDAEKAGKVFIEGKPSGLIREYDLKLSDDPQKAAEEMLNWKDAIREEAIHFKYREIK
jgi:hypothetical protein